jgi:DNA/RNA endonuclease YhcR with UshA esterase domain
MITVRGKVFSVFDAPSGKVFNLNMGPNYKECFKAVIFQSSYSKWPRAKDDLKLLLGQTIKVCGIVKEYKGLPQIIINSPTQIQLE